MLQYYLRVGVNDKMIHIISLEQIHKKKQLKLLKEIKQSIESNQLTQQRQKKKKIIQNTNETIGKLKARQQIENQSC